MNIDRVACPFLCYMLMDVPLCYQSIHPSIHIHRFANQSINGHNHHCGHYHSLSLSLPTCIIMYDTNDHSLCARCAMCC